MSFRCALHFTAVPLALNTDESCTYTLLRVLACRPYALDQCQGYFAFLASPLQNLTTQRSMPA